MRRFFQQIDLADSFRRFPLPAGIAVLATACAIILIAYDGDAGTEMATVLRLLIVFYYGFLGAIISRLVGEARESRRIEWFGIAKTAVLCTIGYFLLPHDFDLRNTGLFRLPYYLLGLALILHLMIAYVPFLTRGSDGDFWEYNRKTFVRFVESAFFSGVLFLALSLAIVALRELFKVDIDGRTYGYLAVSLFGIFHSWYFLSKYPVLEYDDEVERPLSAFLVFSQYILIPVTAIYMLILYAYGAKVLIEWELPRGWIGNLSLWFSVIGVFTYLLNYLNPRFGEKTFVRLFIKYFWLILIVPAILLVVSLSRRISEYGVTEERYILAMITSWIVLMILLYGIMRWRSLKWLPLSLSLFAFVGLFGGPLSMFGCTLRSQQDRLKALLDESGLLSDRGISDTISHSVIYDQLRFMDRRSDLQFINAWLDAPIVLEDESDTMSTTNLQIIADHFGLDSQHRYDDRQYFNYYGDHGLSIDIQGFDDLIVIKDNQYSNVPKKTEAIYLEEGLLYYRSDDQAILIDLRYEVSEWTKGISHDRPMPPILRELGDIQLQLHITQLNGHRYSHGGYMIDDIGGFALIRYQ